MTEPSITQDGCWLLARTYLVAPRTMDDAAEGAEIASLLGQLLVLETEAALRDGLT